jgi:sugar phosphate isomerase/epimerase
MLNYQWNQVAILYWQEAANIAQEHGIKVDVEMYPGFLVYNVEHLLRWRETAGPVLGCNLNPSHVFWNGADVPSAIRKLGDCIFHVHGKDCMVDPTNIAINGCNNNKPYNLIPQRAWTFRTIGYEHDAMPWRNIIIALPLVGYDYVISIEHEDAMMSMDEGLRKGVVLLKQVVAFEPAEPMFWA